VTPASDALALVKRSFCRSRSARVRSRSSDTSASARSVRWGGCSWAARWPAWA